METIAIDLVYSFALELQKMLNILEREFGRDLFRVPMKQKLFERANTLTKNIYDNYKITFDLNLIEENNNYNLEFNDDYNESILFPKDFIESKNYQEVKENLDVYILLMKNFSSYWKDLIFQLKRYLGFTKPKAKFMSSNILERIRFFMSFVNKFPSYITETPVPLDAKKITYSPIYAKWGNLESYYTTYEKQINKNPAFFKNQVRINPIPDYYYWNFNMVFFDRSDLQKESLPTRIQGYPMQIFEKIDSSFDSALFLIDKNYFKVNKKHFKDNRVEKFSITNNFNHFKHDKSKRASQKLELDPFFERHIQYIDDLQTKKRNIISNYKNYEFIIDFTKDEEINHSIDLLKNMETIKEFNTMYDKESKFLSKYSTNNQKKPNPFRVLFKNRYSFPGFNVRSNF